MAGHANAHPMSGSLEDSDRVRTACMRYLQTWLHHFYPEHQDPVAEFEALARELGGGLRPPELSWKYAWIQEMFGWRLAKRARMAVPQFKISLLRSWDKVSVAVAIRVRS